MYKVIQYDRTQLAVVKEVGEETQAIFMDPDDLGALLKVLLEAQGYQVEGDEYLEEICS